ncbi:MAG: hypothetical protein M3483_05925 [Gemmatimonadota bacterium]|nr:hypothetical protein [Gemmatimonadota bacterium]
MYTIFRGIKPLAVMTFTVLAAGCSQLGALGGLGDILGGGTGAGGGSGQVEGEVRRVDSRDQRIELRTRQGQTINVFYDQRTRVVYQGRDYPPTALEAGDAVAMQIQQDARGNYYTEYVTVQRSVREGGGQSGGSARTVTGTVQYIDTQRGQFELRANTGTVLISLPYNLSRNDADRFRYLRRGESVRAEVVFYNSERAELVRFLN